MALNCVEDSTLFGKLEQSLDVDLEDVRACHRKLLDNSYSGFEGLTVNLLAFYFNLPIKDTLKKPVRAILKGATLHKDLLMQHMSEFIRAQVSSQCESMFVCIEECIEHIPGGRECVEELLYSILTGMNRFILSNRNSIGNTNLLSIIKSYHKTIVKCQTALSACSNISPASEYAYIKEQLFNLAINSDVEVESPQESVLFSGITGCIHVDSADIQHTSLIVNIQLMCSFNKDALFLDLYKIHQINMSNAIPNARLLFALTSSVEFLFYQNNSQTKPVFVSIILEIERLLDSLRNQSVTRLQLCRCLHSCIISLSKCATRPNHRQAIRLNLAKTDRNIRQAIVATVMDNWNSHIETIRHLIKEIFMELLSLLNQALLPDEAQTVYEQFAKSFLLLEAKSTTKYKYLCLLSDYIPLSRWINLDPLLPSALPMLMDESALATHVGELWCRLVCQSSVLFSEIQPWIDAVISAVSNVPAKHSQNIYDFCKKGIVACHSDILQYIANQVPKTDEGNLFLIQCIKQAQKQFPSTDVRAILSQDKLKACLIGSSPELSISVLDLICQNPKSTSIIHEQDLGLVLKGFTLLVDTPSVSIRKNLISTLSVLLQHLDQSAHKHMQRNGSLINHYSVFLSNLSSLLFSMLNPTSSQGAREAVLSVLSIIIQLFLKKPALFPSSFEIQDCQLECLLASIKDTFEFHCRMSFDILTSLRDRLSVWLDCVDNYLNFADGLFSLMLSPVSVHSISATYYVRLLFRLDPTKLYSFIQGKCADLNDLKSSLSSELPDIPQNQIFLRCLSSLLCLLNIQLEMSRERWDPSKYCFYSIIRCIRGLLGECCVEEMSSCLAHLKQFLDSVISVCSQVLGITGHIVCNSSPEGYLPVSTDGEIQQQQGGRAVLLCSWHSLKEISLLYSEIIEYFFPPHPSLFYPSSLTAIYSFYLNYLMEARHRGAFELTYVGFVRLCRCLWVPSTDSLCDLPTNWLEEVLSSLRNNDSQESQLKLLSCATRRSAGLPYLVLAILANEPKHLNSKYLSITVETLTILADKSVDTNEDVIVKVHCLNILRALFKDNKLRDLMHQYVPKTFSLVIGSVSSSHWPVRNASQLLFSGIMSRVFGVKRTQDEHAWQNKMTTHSFFTRYPPLWQVFRDSISTFVKSPHSLHPDNSVFLLLTVLSRLYISKSDTNSEHIAFLIPRLFTLCANPCWKLREMCAHSISSLLSSQSFSQVFPYFLQQSVLYRDSSTYNATHGFLLVLREFVEQQSSLLSADELTTLFSFCIGLIPMSFPCTVNHCSLFQIFSTLIGQSRVNFFDLVGEEIRKLNSHLFAFSLQVLNKKLLSPTESLFEQTRVLSFLRVTCAAVSRDIFPNKSDLLSVVHSTLDRPDMRSYLIQVILEMEVSPSETILPFDTLFDLLLDSTQEDSVKIICIIMRLFNCNIAGIVDRLSKHESSDFHRAIRLTNALIEDCSMDDESLPNILEFCCCLILSIELDGQMILNTFINTLFELATPQVPPLLTQAIEAALISLYKVLLSLSLDNETNNKFWFLLLYVVHQCNDSKLTSLIYSTFKEYTDIPIADEIQPQHLHPNVATLYLLENIRLVFKEGISIEVLIFLLRHCFIDTVVESEEQDTEKLFEESCVEFNTVPVIVLRYICSALQTIILNSQNTEDIIGEITQIYLGIREQLESVSETDRLVWNRKFYTNTLLYSLLHNIFQKSSIGSIQVVANHKSSLLLQTVSTGLYDSIDILYEK